MCNAIVGGQVRGALFFHCEEAGDFDIALAQVLRLALRQVSITHFVVVRRYAQQDFVKYGFGIVCGIFQVFQNGFL